MTENLDYVYHPYPKWIKDSRGKDVIVENNLEHRAVLQGLYVHNPEWDTESKASAVAETPDSLIDDMDLVQYAQENELLPCDVPEVVPLGIIGVPLYSPKEDNTIVDAPEEDEKALLLKQADILGVYYDKRWGASKLKAAIDAALK